MALDLNVPKGSSLKMDNTTKEFDIGSKEGLGLYLNGTEFPSEIYERSDISDHIEKIDDLVNDFASLESHWEGWSETALYYYGKSFNEIKEAIAGLIETYPLCEKCRVLKLA